MITWLGLSMIVHRACSWPSYYFYPDFQFSKGFCAVSVLTFLIGLVAIYTFCIGPDEALLYTCTGHYQAENFRGSRLITCWCMFLFARSGICHFVFLSVIWAAKRMCLLQRLAVSSFSWKVQQEVSLVFLGSEVLVHCRKQILTIIITCLVCIMANLKGRTWALFRWCAHGLCSGSTVYI